MRKRDASHLRFDPTEKRCLEEDLPCSETVYVRDDAENRAFELSEVAKPTDHWALHTFQNYDGVGYVLALLDSEKNTVSVEKTVLMNYGESPREVICLTYLRKKLVSESVSWTMDEAK